MHRCTDEAGDSARFEFVGEIPHVSWAREKHFELLHIQPGKPAQNAYIERFNRTYREEVLDAYLFDDLLEVHYITEHWLETYNSIRLHAALQGLPPRQFALQHA